MPGSTRSEQASKQAGKQAAGRAEQALTAGGLHQLHRQRAGQGLHLQRALHHLGLALRSTRTQTLHARCGVSRSHRQAAAALRGTLQRSALQHTARPPRAHSPLCPHLAQPPKPTRPSATTAMPLAHQGAPAQHTPPRVQPDDQPIDPRTWPSATTATFLAAFSTAMVSVMRCAGGLGESETGSTQGPPAGERGQAGVGGEHSS